MTYDQAVYQVELKVDRLFPASPEPMTPTRHAYGLLKWDVRVGARDEYRKYQSVIQADMAANPGCKHRAAIRESLEAMAFA